MLRKKFSENSFSCAPCCPQCCKHAENCPLPDLRPKSSCVCCKYFFNPYSCCKSKKPASTKQKKAELPPDTMVCCKSIKCARPLYDPECTCCLITKCFKPISELKRNLPPSPDASEEHEEIEYEEDVENEEYKENKAEETKSKRIIYSNGGNNDPCCNPMCCCTQCYPPGRYATTHCSKPTLLYPFCCQTTTTTHFKSANLCCTPLYPMPQ